MEKILLIRMDRLGDLICTLPVDQLIEPGSKDLSMEWLISSGLEPLMDCAEPKRFFWASPLKFTWRNLFNLTKTLKLKSFDKVILFYAPWWVSLACILAQIPQRFSPRSRWYQILFFNRTLRQKRSRSDRHEADYNSEVFQWALYGLDYHQIKTPFLHLHSGAEIPVPLPPRYVVLHPGMGGSALNWPQSYYLELASLLTKQGRSVVITGTSSDGPWLQSIEEPIKKLPHVHWLVGRLNLKELIAVLQKSDAVIAPSTGVIHLAASTGTKTFGIYSPIKVQSATRWSPRGPNVSVFTPEVSCPASMKCLGPTCVSFPCLKGISPQQIFKEI